jgi:hypothetical protein
MFRIAYVADYVCMGHILFDLEDLGDETDVDLAVPRTGITKLFHCWLRPRVFFELCQDVFLVFGGMFGRPPNIHYYLDDLLKSDTTYIRSISNDCVAVMSNTDSSYEVVHGFIVQKNNILRLYGPDTNKLLTNEDILQLTSKPLSIIENAYFQTEREFISYVQDCLFLPNPRSLYGEIITRRDGVYRLELQARVHGGTTTALLGYIESTRLYCGTQPLLKFVSYFSTTPMLFHQYVFHDWVGRYIGKVISDMEKPVTS